MTRQYTSKQAGQLKRSPHHIRESLGSEEELRLLGQSFLKRALQPIICRPDLEILDGHRRLEGVLLEAGLEAEVPVCITAEAMTDAVKLEIQMESAIHTRGLSAYEQYLGARQWLQLHPGATAEQLAARIGRTSSMLTRILALERCLPAVQQAAAQGLLGVSEWYEFAKCSEQQQQELLNAKQAGTVTSRDQLSRAGRKSRTAGTTTARVSRVKCPVPGTSLTVQVSGESLSLDDMIEALQELLKEAKKASDRGLDARTFERVCRDLAKKQ